MAFLCNIYADDDEDDDEDDDNDDDNDDDDDDEDDDDDANCSSAYFILSWTAGQRV